MIFIFLISYSSKIFCDTLEKKNEMKKRMNVKNFRESKLKTN